jgi:hypothetical protein
MSSSASAVSSTTSTVADDVRRHRRRRRRCRRRGARRRTRAASDGDADGGLKTWPEVMDLVTFRSGGEDDVDDDDDDDDDAVRYGAVTSVDAKNATITVTVLEAESSGSSESSRAVCLYESASTATVRAGRFARVAYEAYDLEQRKVMDRLEDPHGEHARDVWVVSVSRGPPP